MQYTTQSAGEKLGRWGGSAGGCSSSALFGTLHAASGDPGCREVSCSVRRFSINTAAFLPRGAQLVGRKTLSLRAENVMDLFFNLLKASAIVAI